MSEITLWGRRNSANVQKAAWALAELGLSYAHVPLGGAFKGLDDPQYLALNPNGLVPTLRDGDVVVWESHAILRYLCARYGSGSLWPADPAERAIADQWTDWTATTFQPAWIAVFWQVVRTPRDQHDARQIKSAMEKATSAFAIMERQLLRSDYLAGNGLSYADMAAGVAMYRWTTMDVERPILPGVAAWHQRLAARPAFQSAVQIPYDDLVGRLSF